MAIKKPLLIATIVLTLVPALVINTPVGYMPLVFLILISVVSILYTIIVSSFCRLVVESPPQRHCERESSAGYRVTVDNRSFLVLPHIALSFCIESAQGFPPAVSDYIFMLRPREKKELELPVHFPHIGLYDVRISRLRFYGFLGVFSLVVKPRWKESVRVTPKLCDMSGYNINTTQAVFAVDFSVPHKLSGGEYADVRQYFPGDPIKNIHWKLSAHTSDYMTRVLKTDAVSGVSVYMDFRLPPERGPDDAADMNDCIVESACSIALHALELYYGVEFIYAQSNIPAVVYPKDYDELKDAAYALPPVSAKERYPVELLIAEHSGHAACLDNIVVLTGTVSDRLIGVLSACRQRGKYPLLCHIRADKQPLPAPDATAALLSGKGIEYRVIDSARRLSRMLGGRE